MNYPNTTHWRGLKIYPIIQDGMRMLKQDPVTWAIAGILIGASLFGTLSILEIISLIAGIFLALITGIMKILELKEWWKRKTILEAVEKAVQNSDNKISKEDLVAFQEIIQNN